MSIFADPVASPAGHRRASERNARYRRRLADGRIVIPVEIDEVAVIEWLRTAGVVDLLRDPDRTELARWIETLVDALANETRPVAPSDPAVRWPPTWEDLLWRPLQSRSET